MENTFDVFTQRLNDVGITLDTIIVYEIQTQRVLTAHAIRSVKIAYPEKCMFLYKFWKELMKKEDGYVVLSDEEYEFMYKSI